MTNLWLWNCVPDPWKFSRNNGFYSTSKYSAFLKFELISRKIGLVFFRDGTWFAWTVSLPSFMAATTVMTNCAMFQKWIALHETIYCFQSSEALGGFWSLLRLYMYIQIKTFMYTIMSHKKRRAKYQTEMLSWIAKQQFRYKQCFQWKNTLTIDINDQKFNCDNANGHYRQVELERQPIRTKATRSALRLCLHTIDHTFIHTHFL